LQSDITTIQNDVTNLQNILPTKLSKDGSNFMTGDLNMGGQSIINVNLVDSVNISAFKNDYDSKINQDVKTTANPMFSKVEIENNLSINNIVINNLGIIPTIDNSLNLGDPTHQYRSLFTNNTIINNTLSMGNLKQLGFFGVNSVPQYTSLNITNVISPGISNPIFGDSTFNGGLGTHNYTIGDIVRALKLVGLLSM
jgi:hypothetical protein